MQCLNSAQPVGLGGQDMVNNTRMLCCHLQDFQERLHAEAAAKRAAYEAEVAAGRLATVSQLVKGEVVVRPPPAQGSSSPGRSRSPGEQCWWTVCEVSPGRCRKKAAAA